MLQHIPQNCTANGSHIPRQCVVWTPRVGSLLTRSNTKRLFVSKKNILLVYNTLDNSGISSVIQFDNYDHLPFMTYSFSSETGRFNKLKRFASKSPAKGSRCTPETLWTKLNAISSNIKSTYNVWLLLSFIIRIFSKAHAAYVWTTALSLVMCLINCGIVDTTISLGNTVRNVMTYLMASAFNTGNSFTVEKQIR